MIWKNWERLPENMKTEEVHRFYNMLEKKKAELLFKGIFDFAISGILIIVLFPFMGITACLIKLDSKGPVLFCQERITQYGKKFMIYKFRTMVERADQKGIALTVMKDARITKIGSFLRKYRLDEIPQLFNIVKGEMTFVGTRPEVPRYVDMYQKDMLATLLLPAGVTSMASIQYKEEYKLLRDAKNAEQIYLENVLPQKMKWNLMYLERFSLKNDFKILLQTVIAVLR